MRSGGTTWFTVGFRYVDVVQASRKVVEIMGANRVAQSLYGLGVLEQVATILIGQSGRDFGPRRSFLGKTLVKGREGILIGMKSIHLGRSIPGCFPGLKMTFGSDRLGFAASIICWGQY